MYNLIKIVIPSIFQLIATSWSCLIFDSYSLSTDPILGKSTNNIDISYNIIYQSNWSSFISQIKHFRHLGTICDFKTFLTREYTNYLPGQYFVSKWSPVQFFPPYCDSGLVQFLDLVCFPFKLCSHWVQLVHDDQFPLTKKIKVVYSKF